jgi:hypothetical protein
MTSAVHAAATPAKACPIGLGIGGLSWQILPDPQPTGESVRFRNAMIVKWLLESMHDSALDFRPARF